MNVLSDSVFSANRPEKLTLPGLLAALGSGAVRGFPRIRPHQRAPFHMFLSQLAAIAVLRDGDTFSDMDAWNDEDAWRTSLSTLTAGDQGPWDVFPVNPADPGFLQSPDPGGLQWKEVATPDGIDLPITAKNHDVKSAIAGDADLEDWLLALIAAQTSEGYNGGNKRNGKFGGNFGVARMNGGSSSRVMFGLAPIDATGAIDVSAWWRRDVKCLVATHNTARVTRPGGHALLWTLPWREGQQIPVQDIDPYAIEVCRRFRLRRVDSKVTVRRATSAAARVDAKAFAGVVDDPWAPVCINGNSPKSLTLGVKGRFDYKLVLTLLTSGDWRRPPTAQLHPKEAASDLVIVAEALARGNSKTGGLQTRIIPMPKKVRRQENLKHTMSTVSAAMLDDIDNAQSCLKLSVALFAQGGDQAGDIEKKDYSRAHPAIDRFESLVDARFFDFFWDMVAADDRDSREHVLREFRAFLRDGVQREFKLAIACIPVPSVRRYRALTTAGMKLNGLLRHHNLIEESNL